MKKNTSLIICMLTSVAVVPVQSLAAAAKTAAVSSSDAFAWVRAFRIAASSSPLVKEHASFDNLKHCYDQDIQKMRTNFKKRLQEKVDAGEITLAVAKNRFERAGYQDWKTSVAYSPPVHVHAEFAEKKAEKRKEELLKMVAAKNMHLEIAQNLFSMEHPSLSWDLMVNIFPTDDQTTDSLCLQDEFDEKTVAINDEDQDSYDDEQQKKTMHIPEQIKTVLTASVHNGLSHLALGLSDRIAVVTTLPTSMPVPAQMTKKKDEAKKT